MMKRDYFADAVKSVMSLISLRYLAEMQIGGIKVQLLAPSCRRCRGALIE